MRVFSCIDMASSPHLPLREPEDINTLVIHRMPREYGREPINLVNSFKGMNKTGGIVPRHFWIPDSAPQGTVYQFHALSTVVMHSVNSLSISIEGDFRTELPRDHQLRTLAKLCAVLIGYRGGQEHCGVAPHHEEHCPGKNLSMKDLRARIAQRIQMTPKYEPHEHKFRVTGWGIVL